MIDNNNFPFNYSLAERCLKQQCNYAFRREQMGNTHNFYFQKKFDQKNLNCCLLIINNT